MPGFVRGRPERGGARAPRPPALLAIGEQRPRVQRGAVGHPRSWPAPLGAQ